MEPWCVQPERVFLWLWSSKASESSRFVPKRRLSTSIVVLAIWETSNKLSGRMQLKTVAYAVFY